MGEGKYSGTIAFLLFMILPVLLEGREKVNADIDSLLTSQPVP